MGEDSRTLDLGDDFDEPAIPEGMEPLAEEGRVRCVFSTSQTVKMGMGASARKHDNTVYWFVEQVGPSLFEGRRINVKNVPAGDAEPINLTRLIQEFSPQLAYYEDVVLPAMEELEDILDQGDEYREDGRFYSAEMEYDRALTIEEKSVRALFGLGLIYAERREMQRTRELLADLVQVKAAFDGKNQHLFNEFGISLRKANLFAEATVYYRRGLDFVTTDENLYYNLARAHYEQGEWGACLEGLIISHRLNPGLGVARALFEVIVGLAEDDRLLGRYDKPPVPPDVAARARQILAVESGRLPLDEQPVMFGPAKGRARSGASGHVDFDFDDLDEIDGFGDD